MDPVRVLMFLQGFPTISQTYMLNEVEAVRGDYDVRVISTKQGNLPGVHHPPFELVTEPGRIREIVEDFKPQVLHAHYLHMAPRLAELGEKYGVPFTIRTHSFDSLQRRASKPRLGYREAHAARSDACAAILVFPFVRPLMESIGIPPDRLVDCWPVIDYDRFHDRSPNGEDVINVGACIPKKRMEDFVDLGRLTDRHLNLYAIGYESDALREYNQASGSPIAVHDAVEPHEMPAVYKAHGWLVYTACPELRNVGWPMAVAEAQAAGLGVCFPNIRPDVAEYVGPAGFLYASISEVAETIARPYPEEMREAGFEHAKRSDIARHKRLLTDVWDRVADRPPRIRRGPNSYTVYQQLTEPLRTLRRSMKKRS